MPEAHDRRMSDRIPDAEGGDGREGRPDRRAVTDPTALTIDRVLREIGLLNARFALQISSLSELIDEKLKAVDLQFALVERQRIEQKVDTKTAVDAALAAQKEAVREQTQASERAIAKSETSFVSQINALGNTVQTAIVGITTTLNDTKERLSRVESRSVGSKEAQIDMRAILGLIFAAALVVLGFYAARH
jgi:cobalamin biosynthesis Mg chelatase CobN